jgi:hypothetical protein
MEVGIRGWEVGSELLSEERGGVNAGWELITNSDADGVWRKDGGRSKC